MKKRTNDEFIRLAILGLAIIFIISLSFGNLVASIKFSFVYMIFAYLPFLLFISRINNLKYVEKFVLANLSSLSYASLYIFLDLSFRIPLSKPTFLLVTASVYGLSFLLSKNEIK